MKRSSLPPADARRGRPGWRVAASTGQRPCSDGPCAVRLFGYKDDLLDAVAGEEFAELFVAIQDSTAGLPNPMERMIGQTHAYVEHLVERPVLFDLISRVPARHDPPAGSPRGVLHVGELRRVLGRHRDRLPQACCARPIRCWWG